MAGAGGPGSKQREPSRRWRSLRPTLRDLADAGGSLITTALGLGVAIWLVPSARVEHPLYVVLLALLVGVGDALLRPLLRPLAVRVGAVGALLCGLTAQVLILWGALRLVPGAHIPTRAVLPVMVIAALVMAAGRWLIGASDSSYVLGDVLRRARSRARRAQSGDGAAAGEPGLLIVQLDGLSRPLLEQAIDAGQAPTMARWLWQGSHRLVPWWARVPSTTPASQAGLLHGASDWIPAFRWWDKSLNRLVVTNRPIDAAAVEERLSDGRGLLAHGGVAISTMFSGDAETSLLVMSRAAGGSRGLGPGAAYLRFFASPFVLARALSLSAVEMIKELHQGRRQRVRDVLPRVRRRGAYVALRGVTNVLLRDLNVSLIAEHLQRGAPVIFVDLVDYDEIAHHAGPARPEAMRALEGLDGVLRLLEQVVAGSARQYRIVVLSDHGQSLGATFEQAAGQSLDELVRELLDQPPMVGTQAADEAWGPLNTLLTSVLRRAMPSDQVVLGPDRAVPPAEQAAVPARSEVPEVAVAASGGLGSIWFCRQPGRVSMEALLQRWPRLIAGLAGAAGIGVIVARSEARGPLAIGPRGVVVLTDGTVEGVDPLAPYGPRARADLLRAAGLPNSGDLLVLSAVDDRGQVHAFEGLVGSHGGLGGQQNEALLLHPAELPLDAELVESIDGRDWLVGADRVHTQLVRWLETLGLRPPVEPAGAAAASSTGAAR